MAAKSTHVLTGLALGSALSAVTLYLDPTNCGAIIFSLLALSRLGSTAPDWLEISRWVAGVRVCLIPHRTITHWVPLWAGLCLVAIGIGLFVAFWPGLFLLAFAAGGISHVLLDAFTPMGVPWTHPFRPIRLR